MFPAGGMPDMSALIQQAQQMTQQLGEAQARLAESEVTGTSGGGLVTVVLTGSGDVTSLTIKPEAYDATDPDALATISDLVVAALRDATDQVRKMTADTMGPLTGGLQGMPGMPGLPGSPFGQ